MKKEIQDFVTPQFLPTFVNCLYPDIDPTLKEQIINMGASKFDMDDFVRDFVNNHTLKWSDLPNYLKKLPILESATVVKIFDYCLNYTLSVNDITLGILVDITNAFSLTPEDFDKAGYKLNTTTVIDRLVHDGNLDLLKFLSDLFPAQRPHTNQMKYAAKRGHIEIVEWIYSLPNVDRVVDDDHDMMHRFLRYVRKRNDYQLFLFCMKVWNIVPYRKDYPTYNAILKTVAHTAFKCNQTEIMQWFKEKCPEIAMENMMTDSIEEAPKSLSLEQQLIVDLDSRKVNLELMELDQLEKVFHMMDAYKGNELAFKLLINYIYTNMMDIE